MDREIEFYSSKTAQVDREMEEFAQQNGKQVIISY